MQRVHEISFQKTKKKEEKTFFNNIFLGHPATSKENEHTHKSCSSPSTKLQREILISHGLMLNIHHPLNVTAAKNDSVLKIMEGNPFFSVSPQAQK